jgi:hypothetical protein
MRGTKKMKRNYVLILLLMFVMTCSCQNELKNPHQLILEDWNNKYSEQKSFFPSELTSHFPKTLSESIVTFTDNISAEMGSLELMVIDSIKNDSLVKLQKNLESICIGKYIASDSCLLIINRFLTRSKYYKVKNTDYDKHLIERPCYSELFPIPNFWHNNLTTNDTECKLPADFVLYVIDAKQGKYLKEELLTTGWFMPMQWRNGYSRGIAISPERNIIIYWLGIW